MEQIGNKVKAIREQKKLTTSQLALLAEITRQTVENIENDKVHPRTDTLTKLAKALRLKSVKELF